MNKIMLLGRFTEKPTLAYTQTHKAILKSTIAVNRNFKNSEGQYDADFIRVVAFDKKAEVIEQYFDKGSRILISGRLQTGKYQNEKGDTIYTSDVIVEDIDFIDSKKESGQAVTPYDFQKKEESTDDPFKEFGDKLVIDDNFLD